MNIRDLRERSLAVASVLLTFLSLAMVRQLPAQSASSADDGRSVKPLGLPASWKWDLSFASGLAMGHPGEGQFLAGTGLYRNIITPDLDYLGIQAEAYAGSISRRFDGGARLMASSPFFCLALGLDWRFSRRSPDFIARIWLPLKRGGLLFQGALLHLDFLPARRPTVRVGFTVPLWPGHIGRTRPLRDHVTLERVPLSSEAPDSLESALSALRDHVVLGRVPQSTQVASPGDSEDLGTALAALRDHGLWIDRLAVPYFDKPGRDDEAVRPVIDAIKSRLSARGGEALGSGVDHETRAFHAALDRACAAALRGMEPAGEEDSTGKRLGQAAREILLSEVLLPYDRNIGQPRSKDSTAPFAARAAAAFERILDAEAGIPAASVPRLRRVFAELLGIVESARAESARLWGDPKLVWLPLEFALLPEQHDTQDEIDALIGRAVGAPITEGNQLAYLLNDEFQVELARTIRVAQDYHVLWTHDFSGIGPGGSPDRVSFEQIARGYLAALTERVKDYDKAKRIPLYFIFLDQHYYEIHKSREWMRLLADPLSYRPDGRLPAAMRDELSAALGALRAAVSASPALQEERRAFGDRRLRSRICVQVNITNPAEMTFRSREMLPLIGIPDSVMRDHRKLVFYDVSEEDPYRGEAVYTGMGVGELYASGYWEDRGLVVRGPDNLRLKRMAAELLLSQGFTEKDLPAVLRPKAVPASPHAATTPPAGGPVTPGGAPARLLDIHNRTGFGQKDVNLVRALLYNLLPADTVAAIPDSLWQNYLYAGLVFGAALRGAHVWIIAPSRFSSPEAGAPVVVRTRGLMSRLLIARGALRDEIARAGGDLRLGLYDPEVAVGDLPGRFTIMSHTFQTVPFLRDIYNFDSDTARDMNNVAGLLEGWDVASALRSQPAGNAHAKLHLKASLLISRSAFRVLMGRPEWRAYLRPYVTERARILFGREGSGEPGKESAEMAAAAKILVSEFLASIPPEERPRIINYFLIGSANMDYRSMLMDGEAMVLVAGVRALDALLDLAEIEGLSRWVETQAEIDRLLPLPPMSLGRLLARWGKRLL